jgi:hypothetical protein
MWLDNAGGHQAAGDGKGRRKDGLERGAPVMSQMLKIHSWSFSGKSLHSRVRERVKRKAAQYTGRFADIPWMR